MGLRRDEERLLGEIIQVIPVGLDEPAQRIEPLRREDQETETHQRHEHAEAARLQHRPEVQDS